MKKFLLILVLLPVLAVFALAVFVATLDPNKYRPQIVEMVGKKTGRSIALNGPITLHMSLEGVTFGLQDVVIGNPAWASRKEMASIGQFDLGVAVMPLLDHKLVVKSLKISKADIQLETNAAGEPNWKMESGEKEAAPVETKAQPASASPVAVDVASVQVQDSRLAMRDKDGKTTIFKIAKLSVAREGAGFAVRLDSNFNGAPVVANVTIGIADIMKIKTLPLQADVTYAAYHLIASGKADVDAKILTLDSYKVSAKDSEIHGALKASWGGAKPSATATVESGAFNPADFKPEAAKGTSASDENASAPVSGRVFSDAALPLDGLKAANAQLDIKLAEVVLGTLSVKNVAGKVTLTNGDLNMNFPAIHLGSSSIAFKTQLDASSSPARLVTTFNAPDVDTAELMPMLGMKTFLSAKANATMNITSSGNSLHDLASHANGTLSLLSDGGKVNTAALDSVVANLVTLGSSGNDVMLNCLAARFNIQNGVVRDNGVLADTTASTVLVKGNINLGEENLDMNVAAKARAGKVSAIIPPVNVRGGLKNPRYVVDAGTLADNVVGLLSGKGAKTSPVPTMQTQAGQNACVYTLDHPVAAPAAAAPATNQAPKEAVKDLGKNLLKGLLGR